MISRTPISIAILAIAASGVAWADPVNSLKSAVEKSILENPEVKFKHKSFLASVNERDAATGGWRPKIDLEARTGQELLPRTSPTRSRHCNCVKHCLTGSQQIAKYVD
jgi:hypothetical protein